MFIDNSMIWTIYIIILVYFLLGSVGFHFINKRKSAEESRNNNIKLVTYFIIINALFFSIIFNPVIFRFIAIALIITGAFEIAGLFVRSDYKRKPFFVFSLLIFGLFSLAFYFFSGLHKEQILFTFLVISIFDSFSQICGQLWGKHKLLPNVSPNKTIEGLTGGGAIAIVSSILLKDLPDFSISYAILITAGTIIFALIGDLMASLYKRKYNTKDFSRLIPGHGGVLDRFDSLITGSVWIVLVFYF